MAELLGPLTVSPASAMAQPIVSFLLDNYATSPWDFLPSSWPGPPSGWSDIAHHTQPSLEPLWLSMAIASRLSTHKTALTFQAPQWGH